MPSENLIRVKTINLLAAASDRYGATIARPLGLLLWPVKKLRAREFVVDDFVRLEE
jgi:hypothetical protein